MIGRVTAFGAGLLPGAVRGQFAAVPACVVVLAAVIMTAGCANPARDFVAAAGARDFVIVNRGSPQRPLLVMRKAGADATGGRLHVYLDGDGRPWQSRHRIARDPTSRERLILELMARDPAPSILLGRPCYYGEHNECDPIWWTSHRYSAVVVAEMVSALKHEQARLQPASITLIGYSGGGALAMLIAPEIERLGGIVTVAANLDTDAWTRHHGYSPLLESLNPAAYLAQTRHIPQLHLFGAEDEQVPHQAMLRALPDNENIAAEVFPEFDHRCCWSSVWPEILGEVSTVDRRSQ